MSTITLTRSVDFELQTCISCGCQFAIPAEFDTKLRQNHNSFYCPNGHPQCYSGKSEAEKLREELKRKEQELADKVKQQWQTQQSLDETNRKLARVHNGTCPCCKRNFRDLQAHMKTKHPEIIGKPKRKYTKTKTT